jgi:hypothetical protein
MGSFFMASAREVLVFMFQGMERLTLDSPIFSGPIKSGSILLVLIRDIRNERIIRVWIRQQRGPA